MNPPIPHPVPDCLLTLAIPHALQEEMLDSLIQHPELAPGFTVLQAQGMGTHVALANPMEQVLGRARRVLVQVALQRARLPELIAALRRDLENPRIRYWVTPLLEFGDFGTVQ